MILYVDPVGHERLRAARGVQPAEHREGAGPDADAAARRQLLLHRVR